MNVAWVVFAPFDADQIASLNAYQLSNVGQPFVCGNDASHYLLVAFFDDGWRCLDCDYTEEWAWAWMADWSWRRLGAAPACARQRPEVHDGH